MGRIRTYLGWLRRRPRQLWNDYHEIKAIKKKNTAGKKAYYFGVPEHSNLGDLAQCYCIRRFLSLYFSDYEVIEVFTRNYLDNTLGIRDYLKNNIKKEDLIFFQSGYCTQDIGGREDYMHQMVIQDYPNNRLVMLPQTIFFQNANRKELASKVYNKHKYLFFLARDQVSYAMALEMFPDICVKCYPDIVTTLIGQYEYDYDRKGMLLCLRNDSEKFYSDSELEKLVSHFDGKEPCKRIDTTIRVEPDKIRASLKTYIEDYFREFAKYKLVITDRYHGTIFSLIANTPVIVIQTKDHKVKTGVDWFRGYYDNEVLFAPTLTEAIIEADKILREHTYTKNPAHFEKEFYENLRGEIEKQF